MLVPAMGMLDTAVAPNNGLALDAPKSEGLEAGAEAAPNGEGDAPNREGVAVAALLAAPNRDVPLDPNAPPDAAPKPKPAEEAAWLAAPKPNPPAEAAG